MEYGVPLNGIRNISLMETKFVKSNSGSGGDLYDSYGGAESDRE